MDPLALHAIAVAVLAAATYYLYFWQSKELGLAAFAIATLAFWSLVSRILKSVWDKRPEF